MTDLKLFEISGQYRQLAERLADGDFDAATIADTIEASGLTDALQEKAQGVELVARAAEVHCPAIDAEIARLQALKARRQKIAQGLRDYLKLNMETAGIDRIECPLFCLSIKKNPPAVEVLDAAQVPEGYLRKKASIEVTCAVEIIPDDKDGLDWLTISGPREAFAFTEAPAKDAIKAALKAKQEVPGARLVQHTRLEVA